MNKLAAASVALVTMAGLTGASVASSTAAPERATTHTRHFVTHELASRGLGRNSFGGVERGGTPGRGDVGGFDTFRGGFDRRFDSLRVFVGIALRGGLINGHVDFNDENHFTGRITGGSGKFRGIDGTITGR